MVVDSTKSCTGCLLCLPISDFGVKNGKHRSRCRKCEAEYTSRWRRDNPEKNAQLLSRHRLNRRSRYHSDLDYRLSVRSRNKAHRDGRSIEYKRRAAHRNHLITTYGITVDQYESLLTKQNYLCACCHKKPKKFEVDHDHSTGAIRGLLCRKCNSGIGLLGDDLEGVLNALAYLSR